MNHLFNLITATGLVLLAFIFQFNIDIMILFYVILVSFTAFDNNILLKKVK